jgi:hypothetical protein
VELCTPLDHPDVFGGWICLDMLKSYYVSTPYKGWTSAYSTLSILLQLQSFLFAENVPKEEGYSARTWHYIKRFRTQGTLRLTLKPQTVPWSDTPFFSLGRRYQSTRENWDIWPNQKIVDSDLAPNWRE